MLTKRLNAARCVADALVQSENDIEAAIASASRLAAAIADGRRGTRVAMTIGQDGLVALSRALNALLEARGNIAAAHSALATDRINAGLTAYGMGDVSDCPSTASLTLVAGEDRSVA